MVTSWAHPVNLVGGGITINHQFRGLEAYAPRFDQEMLAKLDCYSAPPESVSDLYLEAELMIRLATSSTALSMGRAVVNGFNLGRYRNEGPLTILCAVWFAYMRRMSLFVFETENVKMILLDHPVYKK